MVLLVRIEPGVPPVIRQCWNPEVAWNVINREIRDCADMLELTEEEFEDFTTFEDSYALLEGFRVGSQIEWYITNDDFEIVH